ncbi:MAG: hypothetical protein KatS3mg031_2266 [Chitinophagales bacterium]|nr:MAG: hypothetical protein KatS3mg031_2266 [Chitinophagales bacterium]
MDRLFFKYLAPFLAISMIPTLAIVLILYFFIRNNITALENNLIKHDTEVLTQAISERNEAIAAMEASYIEQEIKQTLARLAAMQLDPDFIKLDMENVYAFAENLFVQDSSVLELKVIDPLGNPVFQKFNPQLLETDDPAVFLPEDLLNALRRKKPIVGPVELSSISKEPIVTLGQPMLDNTGAFAGALIVKLGLHFIQQIVAPKKFGGNGYMMIVSDQGRIIAHPLMKELLQNPEYYRFDFIKEVVKRKNGTLRVDDHLVSFSTNQFGWTTIVLVPVEEALAATERSKQTVLSFINATLQSVTYFTVLIILFGSLIAVAATIFISKKIINPILDFTQATQRISAGELSLRLEKHSDDEIGELTDSFNKMTQELKREREELLKSNEFFKKKLEELLSVQSPFPVATQSRMELAELEKPLERLKHYLQQLALQENGNATQAAELLRDMEQMDAFLKDLFEHSDLIVTARDFMPVDFFEACTDAMNRLRNEIQKSNASIRCTPLPQIKALRSSIVQLFENLISNALKYTKGVPPEIFISAQDKGEEWLFTVKDNGPGIRREMLSDIFKVQEQRINGHLKIQFGLALCKNIVERHGGKIWAESEVGKGSTFYFTIKKAKY